MADLPSEEMIEQTQRYRADRLTLWKLLQKKRDEYVSAARQHGAPEQVAQEAAARTMRGEVRVFVDDLLLHLREQRAGAFVKAAPREWGVRTELLLDLDPLVPGYIAESLPVVAWTVQIDAAEREAIRLALAERDADWTPWLMRRLDRVTDVSERAAEHVFGGVGKAIGEIGEGVGEGIGGVGKGVGEGASGLAKGVADAVKIAVSVVAVGAVVIGGIWILRR